MGLSLVFKKVPFFSIFIHYFPMDSKRELHIINAEYEQQIKTFREEIKQAKATGDRWTQIIVYYNHAQKIFALNRERVNHCGVIEDIILASVVRELEMEYEQLWAKAKEDRRRKLQALALKTQQAKDKEIEASTKVDHVVEMVCELDINEQYSGDCGSKL